MARKIQRKSSGKKAAAEKILRELQDAKKSDDAPEGLDDLIKSIQNEAKREEKRKKEVTAIVKTIGKSNKQKSTSAKQDDIDPRILELLGIEDYEAELDYEDYAVLLKEAMVKRTISGSEEKEGDTELLKGELKRARSSSGKFKPKKKTVKASNFVGRNETTGQAAQQASGKITTLGRDQEQVRTEIKQERQEELIPLATTLNGIEANLKQILELDKEKNKREKRAANKLRREKATASRRAREARMEGGGSQSDPKKLEKVTKPFTGAFDAIMNFFKNIALGGLVTFLLEVVKDPGIIIRPFYDFGNFIIDFINKYIIGFANFLLTPINLIVDVLNFANRKIIELFNSLSKLNPFDDSDPVEYKEIGDIKIPEIPNLEYPQFAQKQEGGGEVVDANSISMVKGGAIDNSTGLKVKGMGKDTQLIAAQPGEIMMSKKAVDAYGASNLLKANAAAGGSNTPNFGNILGFEGGGMVGGNYDSFAKEMIKVHEGLRLDKYLDSRGFPTIGYGHLIEKGETMPDRITQQKADELFDIDYRHHKKAAEKIPGFDQAGGMQKAALIDLTFNMGPAWASGFPAFKRAFKEGNYEQAGNELVDSAWYGQVGRRAPTIVNLIKGKSANASYLGDTPTPSTSGSQMQMASTPPSSPGIQPYDNNSGGGPMTLPIPQKQQQAQSTSSAGQKEVPGFSAEDSNNFDLIVVKSIYNIVG